MITAKTARKVKYTSSSNVVTVTKKVLSLSLKVTSGLQGVMDLVEKLDYYGEGESLRISGVNLQANDFVAVAAVT